MENKQPLVHIVTPSGNTYITLCGDAPSMMDIWNKPFKITCKKCFEVQGLASDTKKILSNWDF